MSYEVGFLVKDLPEPVTVTPEDSLQTAIHLMLKHDYSQLPVIRDDEAATKYEFVTLGSVLLTASYSGSLKDLTVKSAVDRVNTPKIFKSSDNLFELINGLQTASAVLVVDEDGRLQNIVTAYDTTTFFRQWAEDIMFARDVEESLKFYITVAFQDTEGKVDEVERQTLVDELTSANRQFRRKFSIAVEKYVRASKLVDSSHVDEESAHRAFVRLSLPQNGVDVVSTDASVLAIIAKSQFDAALEEYVLAIGGKPVAIDQALADDAFVVMYDKNEKARPFGELTLQSYIDMFMNERCWPRVEKVFGVKPEVFTALLYSVRETRNKLAHFREDEITQQDRNELRTCAEWLSSSKRECLKAFQGSVPGAVVESTGTGTEPIPVGGDDLGSFLSGLMQGEAK